MELMSSFVELLEKCENGDEEGLLNWIQHNDLNTSLPDGNYPLQMACILDMVSSVKLLIEKGANVDYKYTSGLRVLHYCCQNGFLECAKLLLNSNASVNVKNEDSVTYIGQTMPVYTCGGRTPLHLAAEAGYKDVVSLLLEHNADPNLKDNNEMTPLQIASDRLVLASTPLLRSDMKSVVDILLPNTEEKNKIRTKEEIKEIEIERKRLLQQRINISSADEAKKRREFGILSISQRYVPLHDINICKLGPLRSESMVDSFYNAMITNDFSQVLNQPVESYGVYTFPFLTSEFCSLVYSEIEHYENAASELSLPLYYRHDGNLGSLEDCGFQPLLEAITLAAIKPLVKLLYPTIGEVTFRHAFMTRNWVGRKEDFKKHKDKADITLNICFKKENVIGSTVSFFQTYQGLDPPENHEMVLDYEHSVGYAVLHTGDTWHKTNPIQRGYRSSLILWADRVENK